MKYIAGFFCFFLLVSGIASAQMPVKISIPSLDSLSITADVYEIDPAKPTILLCHQARFSRGEYKETALRLNELGFNCIAIDQRSGGEANGVVNETAKLAKQNKLPMEHLDAKQDIRAAFYYAVDRYKAPIILLGSSYSASLVLEVAREVDGAKAVIAFSPGEYFGKEHSVAKIAYGLDMPVFITCSKEETADTKAFIQTLDVHSLTFFTPGGEGEHGSKALWLEKPDQIEYWEILTQFLAPLR